MDDRRLPPQGNAGKPARLNQPNVGSTQRPTASHVGGGQTAAAGGLAGSPSPTQRGGPGVPPRAAQGQRTRRGLPATGPVAGYPVSGRTVRVVIAEAAPVFRRGLQVAFSLDRDLQIVAEAADHLKAIAAVRSTAPDVVLLDINLPGLDQVRSGWATVRTLLPRVKICLLVNPDMATGEGPHKGQTIAALLTQLGASVEGYLSKSVGLEEVASAIRSLMAGQPVLSPALAPLLVPSLQTASPASPVAAGQAPPAGG